MPSCRIGPPSCGPTSRYTDQEDRPIPPARRAAKSDAAAPATLDTPPASLDDVAAWLRRPFAPEAIKFKLQVNPPAPDRNGVVVAYIDARLVAARLNAVPGLRWSEVYDHVPLGAGYGSDRVAAVMCRLTLALGDDSVTHEDVGTSNSIKTDMGMKGLMSDAFKRAGVKAGIGASIYAYPQRFIKGTDLRSWENRKTGGTSYALTDGNERQLRGLYQNWLDDVGIREFGQPLSHGDVEGAQGDVEADGQRPVADDFVPHTYGDVASPQLQVSAVKALAAVGVTDDTAQKAVLDAIRADTGEQADQYLPRIAARAIAHVAKAVIAARDAAPAADVAAEPKEQQ